MMGKPRTYLPGLGGIARLAAVVRAERARRGSVEKKFGTA